MIHNLIIPKNILLENNIKPNISIELSANSWDDFGFRTSFSLTVFIGKKMIEVGPLKIGYTNQQSTWYHGEDPQSKTQTSDEKIQPNIERLGAEFFSLGQTPEYYKNIMDPNIPEEIQNYILLSLRDVVYDQKLYQSVVNEPVFEASLLRDISPSIIFNQYTRILAGGAILDEFRFNFKPKPNINISDFSLNFTVIPYSKPSSNIHVLISRNGVGKTTLLNKMVQSILNPEITDSVFYERPGIRKRISKDYFPSIISVSFSAFDPFIPPQNQQDKSKGTIYHYIGLKQSTENHPEPNTVQNLEELSDSFVKSLTECFRLKAKKERWLNAISRLESDMNFADMQLPDLANRFKRGSSDKYQEAEKYTKRLFKQMSSGHASILLTTTKLVEKMEERTLVLIDEPESHLHPPLLSAFTRALSELLFDRNGVAIIATHSPVVLQEVPKSCVWILERKGSATNTRRPENETFAENVGVLTREVFGLEVTKSGFHDLLESSVAQGKTYDEILDEYNNQLGFEGKAILRALIASRKRKSNESS